MRLLGFIHLLLIIDFLQRLFQGFLNFVISFPHENSSPNFSCVLQQLEISNSRRLRLSSRVLQLLEVSNLRGLRLSVLIPGLLTELIVSYNFSKIQTQDSYHCLEVFPFLLQLSFIVTFGSTCFMHNKRIVEYYKLMMWLKYEYEILHRTL